LKEYKAIPEKFFVRVPLSNIKFADPYEQRKLEKIISKAPNEAVTQLEALLKNKELIWE